MNQCSSSKFLIYLTQKGQFYESNLKLWNRRHCKFFCHRISYNSHDKWLPVSRTSSKNNHVLVGLLSALLHLSPSDIFSAEITNPIELGSTIDAKTFILDIKVSLNDSAIINLEMQVINEHNWTDRSLSYLCRSFDHLSSGEQYQLIRPVVQIGLLNFSLFPQHPEFYATYKFLNVKNHTLYSDKLRLSVLDLTRTDLATEEDKLYQLDRKVVRWCARRS